MSQTTLTAAVNATARVVSIASTSGAVVGRCLALGSELTRITAVLTGACEVQRGTDGTSAAAHAQGTTVTINTPGSFVPSGALLPAFGPDGTVWTSEGPTVASAFETGGGGGGSPAVPSGSVQFNDAGSFGGDADLSWDNTAKLLTVNGSGIHATGAFFEGSVNAASVATDLIEGFSGTTIQVASWVFDGNDGSLSPTGGSFDLGTTDSPVQNIYLIDGGAIKNLDPLANEATIILSQSAETISLGITDGGTSHAFIVMLDAVNGFFSPIAFPLDLGSDPNVSTGWNDGWFNGVLHAPTLTRDTGNLTISTTTSGDVILNPIGNLKIGSEVGATAGPFTTITSITVVKGIVTDLQGS